MAGYSDPDNGGNSNAIVMELKKYINGRVVFVAAEEHAKLIEVEVAQAIITELKNMLIMLQYASDADLGM